MLTERRSLEKMARAVGAGRGASQFNYDFIVRHFSDRATYSADDVILAAHAVYSWMPTMMGLLSPISVLEAYARELPNFTADNAPDVLAKFTDGIIGNSWVGTSKALHVLRPSVFPIWDSRVAWVFGLQREPTYNNQARYLDYLRWVNAQVNDPTHAALFASRATSPVRTVEFILYEYAKKILDRQRKQKRERANRDKHERSRRAAQEAKNK